MKFRNVLFLIACICGLHHLASAQSVTDKALRVEKTQMSSVERLNSVKPVANRIPDEDFQEQVTKTSKAFRYRPLHAKEWAEAISLAFSADGRYLCVGEKNSEWKGVGGFGRGYNGQIKDVAVSRLWDLETGRLSRTLSGHQNEKYIQSVSLSANGKVAASTAFEPYGERVQIQMGIQVRVPSGEHTKLWDCETGEELYFWKESGMKAAVAPDGTYVVTSGSGQISAYATTGKSQSPIWQTKLDCFLNAAPLFSSDGKTLLMSIGDGIAVIDPHTGRVIRQIGMNRHKKQVDIYQLDTASKLFLTAAKDSVIIWDFEKGTEIRQFLMYEEFQDAVALHIRSDEPVVQLITENGWFTEWDIRTGERMRIANLTLGERIDAAAIAQGGNLAAIALDDQGTVDLVDLATGEFGIRFHNLHQDRQWFAETASGHIDGPPEILNLEQLVLAEQKLQYDSDAVRAQCLAMRQRTAIGTAKTTTSNSTGRRLFVLAVGVSEHKYSEYNLHYAHRDAELLAQLLRTIPNKALREVFAQVYANKEATADHIRQGLDWLVRSCGPEDVAIVLFSGHGVRGRNGLYFVPYEGDAESIQSTCLNWSDAAGRIVQTKASQVLFFADCCHAGAFSTENRPTQDDIARAFEKKQGLLLFCSSTGDQKSVEQEAIRQGVFTAAIIDAFHGNADANSDKVVTTTELVEYVTKSVGSQTNSKQTPNVPYPEQFDRNFEVVRTQ